MEIRTTLQLVHRRLHSSDEAANLFDKPEALAISPTPAGVNDEHQVREVSACPATRPPLSLVRGLLVRFLFFSGAFAFTLDAGVNDC